MDYLTIPKDFHPIRFCVTRHELIESVSRVARECGADSQQAYGFAALCAERLAQPAKPATTDSVDTPLSAADENLPPRPLRCIRGGKKGSKS